MHERKKVPVSRHCLSLLIGGLLFLACSPPGGEHQPNVILISIDTIRPDHLSVSGYARPTSPFLDRLAARGWIFRKCSSTSSWTAPAMASLFTGLYPRSHGVRHGAVRQGTIVNQERLDDSFLTLAEALKARGYATFGVSTNGHVTSETGMAQGFDTFTSLWFADAAAAHRAALGLKDKIAASRPYFFWIHYFDPHAPYLPREPWLSRYSPNPALAREWGGKDMRELRLERGEILRHPELVSTLVDLYDAEINYTDGFLERLFNEVVALENSLVIVTSDHGESFGEHGDLGHGESLFEEEIAVPLIVVLPRGGRKGKTVESPVSLIDVFPTVLDFLGCPAPSRVEGRSLLPLLTAGTGGGERPLITELDRAAVLTGVRSGRWKLVAKPRKTESKWLLFDLALDPGESANLAGKNPGVFRDLCDRLKSWESSTPEFQAAPAAMNRRPERIGDLKALGYL
ncbi:MAG: sulfatase [Candidatus Aureabacteria bacterium]|nr:sulfatase [Candidatus Auribacterota bacterium]